VLERLLLQTIERHARTGSRAEFIAKMGVAEEEADEVQFWLELICEDNLVPVHRLDDLQLEARELTAIFAASRKSASRGGK
jgi:four helix bundle protein